jgi:DNA-directed RNA polymerase specialized sigma24 family protein
MQQAVERWKQEHPEEVRRLRERAEPLAEYLDSPEWHAFWRPAKEAISRGDKTGLRAWAEDRIGRKPDFVTEVSYLGKKELGDATPRETWALVDDRGEKLAGEAKGEPDDEGIAVFDEKSKKYPRLRRALSEYADPTSEIDRAIRIAGAESPHGYPLTLGEIEWRIERDNRWRGIKGTPGEDSPRVKAARARVRAAEERAFAGNLKPQEHRDAVEALRKAEEKLGEAISHASTASLSTGGPDGGPREEEDETAFVPPDHLIERLFLDHYASPKNPAGLTPAEWEVFRLAIHLEHREIAEEVGSTEGSVRKLKHQAVKKVRKHGEITVRDHIDTNAHKRCKTRKSA